jgi:hypothetical protein
MKRVLAGVAAAAVLGGALALAFAHETGGPQGATPGMMGQMGGGMGPGGTMGGGSVGPMSGMMGMPAGGDSAERPNRLADVPGSMMAGRGMEEMEGFMGSERMPQAMAAMMEMARRMGDGDPMAGMVRMMEMMSMMGQMGGMMGPGQPQPSR